MNVNEMELKIITDILNQITPEYDVFAFGSRMSGENQKYSDLDLVFKGSVALSFRDRSALTEAFQNSNLTFSVDFHDWQTIPEHFKYEIARNNIQIFTRKDNGEK